MQCFRNTSFQNPTIFLHHGWQRMPAAQIRQSADLVSILYPTTVRLGDESDSKPTSWIQVAKIGKWFSQKYGNIAIAAADLEKMLYNFSNVTPVSPTRLPVDYDHMSLEPKAPGDGKAAGWFTGEIAAAGRWHRAVGLRSSGRQVGRRRP